MFEIPNHPNCRCFIKLLKNLSVTSKETTKQINEFKNAVEKNSMTTYADILCPKCKGSWMTEFLVTATALLRWIKNQSYGKPYQCIHCKHKFKQYEVIDHIEDCING